ncbi:alpha-N-acetylglucosaminidase-like isoform X3 [Macrobrachium rosenbergii]|uniref:alpha-N-acetylglucosaminidase-like isoform X3 n=2 Tax=Macrobrachium rosenbergii TaxID=79674 RepID=UPI0034D55F08
MTWPKNMRGFQRGGAFKLVLFLASLKAIYGFAIDPEGSPSPSLVPPWEEHLKEIRPQASPDVQTAAVEGLVKRLLPDRASEFSFSVDPSIGPEGRDTFQVVSPGMNASVDVVATSGVAAAWGLLHYLKYSCNAHVSWEADQLSLPDSLPEARIQITSNDRFRYYQNVCTVSYSMAWWKWSRWEREIDWMALNGINMPLAFTGQEAIWQRVYSKLGVTQEELDNHFAGPAFLAWGRMGNIFGWGGPLPQSWHEQTLSLQHQILQRMREFGMYPVLPAFAGHVPAGLTRVYPDANITRLGPWSHFNCTYSCTYLLDPNDPLFQEIGSKFIQEMTSEFGTDHLYNCDTFNEMTPQSSDSAYLRSVGASVYSAMTKADPSAIWVMQGWLFYNAAWFWQKPQAEALLTSVPIGRMLVLDLASEMAPQYSRLESYFGQPFIFCMLHDYGGVDGFFGNVDGLLSNMMAARTFPNVTIVGTGLTPEGINQNYVMYDLMNELAWRTTVPNITDWAKSYSSRRYNSADTTLQEAWQLLMKSVYNNGDRANHGNYIIMRRPNVKSQQDWIWYSVDDVVKAWDLFIEATLVPYGKSNGFGTVEQYGSDSETGKAIAHGQELSDSQELLEEELQEQKGKEEEVVEEEGEEQSFSASTDTERSFLHDSNKSTGSSMKKCREKAVTRPTGTVLREDISLENKASMMSYSPGEGNMEKSDFSGAIPDNLRMRTKDTDTSTKIRVADESRSRHVAAREREPTFLHDLVDMTRQVLQILGGQEALRMIGYYHDGDKFGIQLASSNLQSILADMDSILATSPDFLLGAWTRDAASWATNEQERELYVHNALNQVTIWGPEGQIVDYAGKQWSGLISRYVQPRWNLFSSMLIESLEDGQPFDSNAFEQKVFSEIEEPLSRDVNATFPAEPTGDTITTALLLYAKYRPLFKGAFKVDDSSQEQDGGSLDPKSFPTPAPLPSPETNMDKRKRMYFSGSKPTRPRGYSGATKRSKHQVIVENNSLDDNIETLQKKTLIRKKDEDSVNSIWSNFV